MFCRHVCLLDVRCASLIIKHKSALEDALDCCNNAVFKCASVFDGVQALSPFIYNFTLASCEFAWHVFKLQKK